MSQMDKQALDAQIDKALALRLEGNEKLKAGDYPGAMMAYHQTLLSLKGLDSAITSIYGAKPPPPILVPSKVEELTDEQAAKEEEKKGKGKELESAANGAEKKDDQPETKQEVVKTAILNTYVNQAMIHIKMQRWKRALDCALEAKKIDENHPKANFREAQARIGLGEVNQGKKMLLELQKKNPDQAIAAALQQLALDEKTQSKTHAQFRGMFARKSDNGNGKGDKPAEASASGSTPSVAEVKKEEEVKPKIEELPDDPKTA
ncbi:hypothetical protein JCM8097_003371 [Rhodosporidiobolus ruineniae]